MIHGFLFHLFIISPCMVYHFASVRVSIHIEKIIKLDRLSSIFKHLCTMNHVFIAILDIGREVSCVAADHLLPIWFWYGLSLVNPRLGGSLSIKLGFLPASPCHDHMPVILHCVISPAGEKPGNNSPSVPMDPVRSEKPFFFLFGKRGSVDSGVQLIEPSQPTALPWSSRELFSYGVPVMRSMPFHQFPELLILSWPPMASGAHLIIFRYWMDQDL